MGVDRIGLVTEAIYESALAPERWPTLLEQLSALFNCHFADVFARIQDHTRRRGLAFGLDRDDYETELLGTWSSRNVWGTRHPVRTPGEVVTTRQMVPKPELMRSAMYNEYLAPRGLHEGLRLAIWADSDWIQDVSLLRPWSAGPFSASEVSLARALLPHLQRAAAIARRLRQAAASAETSIAALDALRHAVVLLDDDGRPVGANRAADALFAGQDALALDADGLSSGSPGATDRLRKAVAKATGKLGPHRLSASVRLPDGAAEDGLTVTVMPLGIQADWALLRPPAAMAVVTDPQAVAQRSAQHLATLFGLTEAEAELATDLLAGRSVAEVAIRRGRSVHTIRTHLARLMLKTHTNRQGELIRRLMSVPPADGVERPAF